MGPFAWQRLFIPTTSADQLRSITGIHSLNGQVTDTMPAFSFVLICAVLLEECKSEKYKTEQHCLFSVNNQTREADNKHGSGDYKFYMVYKEQ